MQGSRLYVGNLNYAVTDDDLEELFTGHGSVQQANVIRGKGFGFVEMSNQDEAESAKEALNGNEFQGRTMRVDEAHPPKSRPKKEFQSY